MSQRVQAKLYPDDTIESFYDRLRLILPNINENNRIGLYHLYFIHQEMEHE